MAKFQGDRQKQEQQDRGFKRRRRTCITHTTTRSAQSALGLSAVCPTALFHQDGFARRHLVGRFSDHFGGCFFSACCGLSALRIVTSLASGAFDIVARIMNTCTIHTTPPHRAGHHATEINNACSIDTDLTVVALDVLAKPAASGIIFTFPIDATFSLVADHPFTRRHTRTISAKLVIRTSAIVTRIVFALAIDTAFAKQTTDNVAIAAYALTTRTKQTSGTLDKRTEVDTAACDALLVG